MYLIINITQLDVTFVVVVVVVVVAVVVIVAVAVAVAVIVHPPRSIVYHTQFVRINTALQHVPFYEFCRSDLLD